MQNIEFSLSTVEVAKMLDDTPHKDVLKKLEGRTSKDGRHIKGYIEILTERQMSPSDFFIPSTYKDASGKENKCYQVTRKGCDFLANKFTGEKGVVFTARYVKRFHEMEEQLLKENHMDWFVNDVRVFQHREFGILRTLKLDGQDYFVRLDVTRSLGYVNNTDTLKKRVSDSEKCYVGICDGNRCRKMVAITRKGLDELIKTGRLPLANKYNEWIRKQVFPMLSGSEVVPVKVDVRPLGEPPQLSKKCDIPEIKNPIRLFRELMALAENRGIKVQSVPLKGYKSMLRGDRIGIADDLSFQEVIFELAFELAHAHIHFNCGDMVNSPDSKEYNKRAEFAACMMIDLLNIKVAWGK